MNYLKKPAVIIFLFLGIMSLIFRANFVQAQTLGDKLGVNYAANIELPSSQENDVRDMAVVIIKYLITFIGIIAVIIILYGGFIWMTAGGNDDRVTKAKNIIIAGVIGLIIVIAAFAIVNFVINMSEDALNGDL